MAEVQTCLSKREIEVARRQVGMTGHAGACGPEEQADSGQHRQTSKDCHDRVTHEARKCLLAVL